MEEQTLTTSKQAILDAAQALLVQYGYAGLSMRELALASGLAKATLYHYFQDKEEIFRQVVERDMRNVHELIVAAIDKEENPLAKLRAFVYTHFTLLHERRTTIMGVMRELGKNKEMFRDIMCSHRNTHLMPLMNIIQQGIDEGIFRPVNVEYTAYSLFGMINSLAVFPLFNQLILGDETAISTDSSTDINTDAVEHILQLILGGIQAPPLLG